MKQELEIYKLRAQKEDDGLRLDQFLGQASFVKNRSQALKMIANKSITSYDEKPLKASYRIKSGESFEIKIHKESNQESAPHSHPLDIFYEDQDILVLHKPAGLVVHPGCGHKSDTLVNVLFHHKKLSPQEHTVRPGIVHRLDKDTSGLLVLAKTKQAESSLIQQFKNREVKRVYWALAYQTPHLLSGTIESYMCRHPVWRKKFISFPYPRERAKRACTHYKVLKQHKSGICWLECQLETGRTHQIRIHMTSLGSPLLGETVYTHKQKKPLQKEFKKLNRIALHAHSLEFTHPTSHQKMSFCCPWPLDLENTLTKLNFLNKKDKQINLN